MQVYQTDKDVFYVGPVPGSDANRGVAIYYSGNSQDDQESDMVIA